LVPNGRIFASVFDPPGRAAVVRSAKTIPVLPFSSKRPQLLRFPPEITLCPQKDPAHPKFAMPNGLSLHPNIYSFVNKYPLDTLLRHTDSSIVAPVQRHIASRPHGLGVGTSPI
jgi:hypothetical protein